MRRYLASTLRQVSVLNMQSPKSFPGGTSRSRASRRLTTATAVGWLTSAAALGVGMATTPWGDPSAPDIVQAAAIVLAVLSPVTVGAILMFRLPRNAIGRVLLVSGLMLALNIGTTGLAQYGLVSHPGSVPGAIWVAVFSEVTWVPFMVGLALYLPLLFPSGRLPSPRWRPVAVLGLVAIGISTLQNAFSPFAPGTFPPEVVNPLAVGGPVADLLSLLGAVLTIL